MVLSIILFCYGLWHNTLNDNPIFIYISIFSFFISIASNLLVEKILKDKKLQQMDEKRFNQSYTKEQTTNYSADVAITNPLDCYAVQPPPLKNSNVIQNSQTNQTHFKLISVDFNTTNRQATIVGKKITHYKTIEGYKQQNYEKFAQYSDWKCKEKDFRKSIFLFPTALENLHQNEHQEISALAFEIIKSIPFFANDVKQQPSWFKKELFHINKYKAITKLHTFYVEEINKIIYKIYPLESEKSTLHKKLYDIDSELQPLENELQKLVSRYEKVKKDKVILFRNSRMKRLSKKSEKLYGKVSFLRQIKKEEEQKLSTVTTTITSLKTEISKKHNEFLSKEKMINNATEERITHIKPVSLSNSEDDSFYSIAYVNSLPHILIEGCYIIRNNFNGKYYVGQSHDVKGRLKQHFKGSEPKNGIFAEDYWTTPKELRENVYSVKILKKGNNESLNEMEMRLIAEYDSCNSGYNQTKGNNT